MQRHNIAAQIILLILSFINLAFAAPVLVRGIREVAEDVTIASQKRWNPSDKWWTNAPDRTNTPASSASSDSDYWQEQELGLRDPRSPMALNSSHSSLRSRASDNSHPSQVSSPPPAHNDLPDLNVTPQPSLSDNSHHSMGSESESHAPIPSSEGVTSSSLLRGNLDIDLNRLPAPTDDQLPPALPSDPRTSKRPYPSSDDSDPGPSKRPHVPSDARPPTRAHSPSNSWLDTIPLSEWYEMWGISKSSSASPLHDSNPPPQHGNLDQFLNRPLSGSGETDGQPSLSTQSDPRPSTWAHSPSDSWLDTIPPSEWYEMWGIPKSSSASPLHDSNPPPQHGNFDQVLNLPLSASGPTDGQPPLATQSDPGPSRQPFSPLDAGSPTGPHPPSNPGPLEPEFEEVFSEIFRGRFKRHISGSRYVNAAY